MQNYNFTQKVKILFLLFILGYCFSASAEAASFPWGRYARENDAWYRSADAGRIAQNILSWQDGYGSWPKNIDTSAKPFSGKPDNLKGTFDNGATTGEMRFLARAFNARQNLRYKIAFNRGLDLILKAQYPTGGWPQHYPPGPYYHRHITFNDGAMIRLMELLREIANSSDYDFVDADRRAAAQEAFNRGIDCILKCQIRVDGKLKVWCAQHDEIDYSPRPARSYELISLSGGESAGILRLLMSLDNPTPEIVRAVIAGVNWYKEAKIESIRIKRIDGKLKAFNDPNAPPLWGRFYEIKTNRPFFCNRDGIPKYDYNQLDQERSGGYRWYGNWGQDVFRDYEKWSKRWAHLLLPEGANIQVVAGDSTVCNWPESDVLKNTFFTSDKPFLFSADVSQQGNYRVTLTLGGNVKTVTCVKAEARRLMLENVETAPNTTQTYTIIVNVRNSKIRDGQSVKLKDREIGTADWDNRLTLEFNGTHPSVRAVEIEKVDNMPTIFLAGDSTVTDQTKEPWTSWGQMLTRFFKPEIAVANYAESGETLRAFIGERRLEKILTQIKSGDYLLIQFAHNDMKLGTPEEIGYQKSLIRFIDAAREHGSHPVLVTSMHRRRFDKNGKVVDTMQGFPEAMKAVAKEQNVPLIDLHAMSRQFYEALGPEDSAKAFVDGTHHNAYGAYELAKCVIEGIKANVPELAGYIIDDIPPFDPAKPDCVNEFDIPASPVYSDVKPEGS